MQLMKIQEEDSDLMANGHDLPNYSKAGTGKTLSALAAFGKAGHSHGLVLAPPIALSMWAKTIEEYLGASVTKIDRAQTLPLKGGTDFVVCGYDRAKGAMRRDIYEHFDRRKESGALICDESDKLRGHTSTRTHAVYGEKCDGKGGFLELFDQHWPLTGNPIRRHNDDMWSQLAPLFPDVLARYGAASYDDFTRQFCWGKVKQFHKNMPPKFTIMGSQNQPILNHILYKVIGCIRRLEAPELPPLLEEEIDTPMSPVPKEYASKINKMSEAQIMKALLGMEDDEDHSMQQIWQAVTLAKVKAVTEYAVDSAMDSPILLGVFHKSVGEAYEDSLSKAGLNVERVYGATPERKREQIRDSFNSGNLDVIVGQIQAMGVSWNLQECSNHVILAQDHYSPGDVEQFYKRVYRFGQDKTTRFDIMTSQHPLDRVIRNMRKTRAKSEAQTLDGDY